MSEQLRYEDVAQYVRTFPANEDFAGLLRLVLIGIDNLRENVGGEDIVENAHLITEAQAGFLKELLEGRAESIEWFKDNIGHSSLTGLL